MRLQVNSHLNHRAKAIMLQQLLDKLPQTDSRLLKFPWYAGSTKGFFYWHLKFKTSRVKLMLMVYQWQALKISNSENQLTKKLGTEILIVITITTPCFMLLAIIMSSTMILTKRKKKCSAKYSLKSALVKMTSVFHNSNIILLMEQQAPRTRMIHSHI